MVFSSRSARPHDIQLVDGLAGLPAKPHVARVFRATRLGASPAAFSTSGGRWAPPDSYQTVPVLYTSHTHDGAISEVAAYLSRLTPVPSKPIAVHTLEISASAVVELTLDDLEALGVDLKAYSDASYARLGAGTISRTQEIGAVLNFLERDGLIVPSARWPAQNLVVFADNHALAETLATIETNEVDWMTWVRENAPDLLLK